MALLLYWNDGKIKKFQSALLHWYKAHRRNFPWRINNFPYRVWISEIMLQQTQAATVVPYFNRFMERFPDLESLARSSERRVMEIWTGLGYYARARNALRAARRIVRRYGSFPKDYETILSLPGIGRYTAGAICSICFKQPRPVVDGNVRRVLSRLHGAARQANEADYWDQMSYLLPEKDPSSFNQAMMELGATICTPRVPGCPQCPVRFFCRARALGIQDSIPEGRPKPSAARRRLVALVLEKNGRTLLTSMDKPRFIPGQWGLPCRLAAAGESAERAAASLCRKMLGRSVPLLPCAVSRHSITRYRISVFGFYGKVNTSELRNGDVVRWAGPVSCKRLMISSLFLKVLEKCAAAKSG